MILYVNNFRGFSKTSIEFSGVNLLVGENSTGKTSIMSLISLLSSHEFLLRSKFKNQFVDLGRFDEIINKGGSDSLIDIGVFKNKEDNHSIDKRLVFDGTILRFSKYDGFPFLHKMILTNNRTAIVFEFFAEDSRMEYHIIELATETISDTQKLIPHLLETPPSSWNVLTNRVVTDKSTEGPALANLYKTLLFGGLLTVMILEDDHKGSEEKGTQETRDLIQDFRKPAQQLFAASKALLPGTIWVAPIRSKPQRIYEEKDSDYSAEGIHVPQTLKKIFKNKTKLKHKAFIKGLEKFGKESKLFDKIDIGLFGDSEMSPFSINIEKNGRKIPIVNVGYGVSQILPIITELLIQGKESIFLIQQPEVHLHPKSQAAFGELIFNQFASEDKLFFVETHSEYVVDRIKINLRKSRKKKIHNHVNILFFENTELGNKVTEIKLDKGGNYAAPPPDAYRDFFITEGLDLLGF